MTYLANFGIVETFFWALILGVCLGGSFRLQYWLNISSRKEGNYLSMHPIKSLALRILAFLLSFAVITIALVSAKRIPILTLDIRLVLVVLVAIIFWFVWSRFRRVNSDHK
jgi:Na+/glutamate symporter